MREKIGEHKGIADPPVVRGAGSAGPDFGAASANGSNPVAPDFAQLPAVQQVPRLSSWSDLSTSDLVTKYENQPVVFEGMATHWPATSKWTKDFFLTNFGRDRVVVNRMGSIDQQLYLWRAEALMADFIEAVNAGDNIYLAEWYVLREHPELQGDIAADLPAFLGDDWLDVVPSGWAFSAGTRNTFYWGGPDTQTGCHYDNLHAVTWNAVLRGTKRWLLFSGRELPGPREVAQARLGSAGLTIGADSRNFVTTDTLARYLEEGSANLPKLEFWTTDMGPGDVIFVPSQWFHQVHNLTECLAVSRYYTGAVNYAATRAWVREQGGTLPSLLFSGLLGGPRRRSFWRSSLIKRIAEAPALRAMVRASLGALRVGRSS